MSTKSKIYSIVASIDRKFLDEPFIGTEPTPKQEIILDKINNKTGCISQFQIINTIILN
jgi:hypothetical protein